MNRNVCYGKSKPALVRGAQAGPGINTCGGSGREAVKLSDIIVRKKCPAAGGGILKILPHAAGQLYYRGVFSRFCEV
ncbi:hypothetical protein DXC51_05780 [Eisenbergiella massiliensis]|uniref:Uncharacterized protein n=1 Tax=Eisenbergiella massiliensis TaxID=1720294 RepID=A0A3E3I8R6_9FIRM|nr:hypothetical protein DXC51_05780 [Eisenbergiella massiliensis]